MPPLGNRLLLNEIEDEQPIGCQAFNENEKEAKNSNVPYNQPSEAPLLLVSARSVHRLSSLQSDGN